jgi:hypothetical protein
MTCGNQNGGSVTEPPEKPPPGFSAFKSLLEKLVKVPKREIDEKEAKYQKERERLRKNKAG